MAKAKTRKQGAQKSNRNAGDCFSALAINPQLQTARSILPISYRLFFFVIAFALALFSQASARQMSAPHSVRVEGTVTDQNGAPIIGAEVIIKGEQFTRAQITDAEGRFAFDSVASISGAIIVRAKGFASSEKKWAAQNNATARLDVTLAAAPISEQVTITAARTLTRVSDTAASVVVLSADDLSTTAALTVDDALRQIPGFSLFRRSGSRTANPTSQGVSLRGVGASGASRAAVMVDGIPLNDPFGGWVYWGRAPRASLGRVEVVRGGASHLYGTDALGGVINLITRDASEQAFSLEASYGNQQTRDVSFYAGGRIGKMGAQLAAEAFHTDGYIIVDERERGRVDTPAGAQHTALNLTLERLIFDNWRVFARGSLFGESRANGAPLQRNRTHIRQLAVGGDWQSDRAGAFSARAYAGAQVFDQDFSAVSANRDSEALTRSQRVPAQQVGLSAQWSRSIAARQTIVAGLDAREVRGASDELGFVAGRLTSALGAGGRERTVGAFGQNIISITARLVATIGARFDRWRNYDALSASRPLASPGPSAITRFRDRTERAFSPRLSLLYRVSENISLAASGYRAFRAPTLNELYRSFRVGNVVTLANDRLQAERLTGGEAGASFTAFDRKLNARGVFFWSEITRPIANVTLSFTPELITRQRRNLGRTRSRGIELETDARLSDTVTVSCGYQFVDATTLKFPASVALEGLLIPQAPRHLFTFQARYVNPSRAIVGIQGRAVGSQFDDDQNRFRLDRYFTLDAFVSRPVGRGVEIFAAFENLLNQDYAIGRTPVRTVGPKLLARVGLRLRFGAH